MARVSGVALACVGAGVLVGYAGIKGYSIPQTIQDVITGKSPVNQTQSNPITGGSGAGGGLPVLGAGSATGTAIAEDALQYRGAGYVWDGSPAQGIGNWDCSSFTNWVVGHDERLAIPGYAAGTYTGTSHGPNTVLWLATALCTTVGHSGAAAQAGDLCVWQTHMGISIGGGQMISAQDPSNGTQVSGIDGFMSGELLFIRRLKATDAATAGGGAGRKR